MKINKKMIKEMCGAVSYKKGDAFYRGNKVILQEYRSDYWKAMVKGKENFSVIIEKDEGGRIKTTCSCPQLTSFQKDCQHIAAVLLAIHNYQESGLTPIDLADNPGDHSELADGLLHIFKQKPIKGTNKLSHFEKRKVKEISFICKLLQIEESQPVVGIEILLNSKKVPDIRVFLQHVSDSKIYEPSSDLTYNPNFHYFENEVAVVLHHLYLQMTDELIVKDKYIDVSYILIPPSTWDTLFPALLQTPSVSFEFFNQSYRNLDVSYECSQLTFDFCEAKNNDYQLIIHGMDQLDFLDTYHLVFTKRNLIQLDREDFNQLLELKKMVDAFGTNKIPISKKQVVIFLEKVIPNLKKFGEVSISEKIQRLIKSPVLHAKLYLDRINNRLLAGLEFCYDQMIINPLEQNEKINPIIGRDLEKENTILELMDESLFTKTDSGYYLQNEELEYEFLHHMVPRLEKLVHIYATTAVRNRILKENPPVRIRIKMNKERTNWLEFKFEMDGIYEKQIREILLAIEEKRKYYRLRNGSLFSLENKEWDEIRRFMNEIPGPIEELVTGISVPIINGIVLMDSFKDQDKIVIEETFRQFLNDIQHPEHLPYAVPKSLKPILRDYQIKGFKWFKLLSYYGFGGILADSMGLGKTIQSIAFIMSELPIIREKKEPVLIICPSSLMYNWLSEIKKFASDICAVVVDGHPEERFTIQEDIRNWDVAITSYPLLRKDIKTYEKLLFHSVFFDEAQAFKNPNSQTAKQVKKLQAGNRFALTGTPVENSLEELWSIYHVVFPELFRGYQEFSNLTRKTISRRVRPFLLRRLKKDVLRELPEKTEYLESTELLPDQKKLYAAYLAKLKHDTFKHLDKDTIRKNKIKILAGITRLRQICCHPSLFVHGYKGSSAKFEQLLKLLEESIEAGRRVLIFSQFTKMLELIGRELVQLGYPYFYLDGQTPAEERLEICRQFNEGERDLFLISLKAGGTGLNLTGADTVILYDIWWNPAVEAQAADRAHRIGQTKEVQVIKLVARGTIEEKMNELQEKKRQLIDDIIDPEKGYSNTLTEKDIQELLM